MLSHIILRRQGFEGATVFRTAKVILGLIELEGAISSQTQMEIGWKVTKKSQTPCPTKDRELSGDSIFSSSRDSSAHLLQEFQPVLHGGTQNK